MFARIGTVVSLTFVISVLPITATGRDADDGRFIAAVEQARTQLGLPGFALAIVKEDQVIFVRGFGLRDVERNLPVTPDTLFAIGSCTKAFTAMACAIAADEGKLLLDDSPKKSLPDFRLRDPEADQKITIRDMLAHRSGLGGTDLAWYTGALDRDEVIRIAGIAKPTAPFRSKWQYQNVMYSAAGEAAARALETTYEQLITDRILRPLGMTRSNLTVEEMQQAEDFARGYSYDAVTKQTRPVPMRDLSSIAPAGAINSSVNEMAQWIRLMLGRGEVDGKRLVSEERFTELLEPHMQVAPGAEYTLGWLVHQWHGAETFEHAGGIDGFNAYVVFVPEEKLGYVLLTNVTSSTLNHSVREIIWNHLVDPSAQPDPAHARLAEPGVEQPPPTRPDDEMDAFVGKYGMIEILRRDGHLIALAPAQPPYPLERVEGDRYRLTGAPDGFFITFRQGADGSREIHLEQPHGDFTLPRDPAPGEAAKAAAEYAGPHKDLLGAYVREDFSMELMVRGGKVVMLVPQQPAYTLVEKGKDVFSLPPLPDSFELTIRRDADEKVVGVFLRQPRPQPDMELKRTALTHNPQDVDAVIDRAVDAAGGETNLRKPRSLSLAFDMELENQGLTGTGRAEQRAPDFAQRTIEFFAFGKSIGTVTETFEAARGTVEGTFMPAAPIEQAQLDEAQAVLDFHGPAGWRSKFESIRLKGKSTVGDAPCSVLEMHPAAGPTVTVHVCDATGRVLRREFPRSGDRGPGMVVELFSDYREVDGIMLPFRTEQTSDELGRVIMTVREVEVNAAD